MKMKESVTVEALYEAPYKTIARALLEKHTFPWECLSEIKEFILSLGKELPKESFDNPSEGVWIAKSAKVFPSAYIGSPCIIDENAEIRHCAFIRGSAIVGKNVLSETLPS